MGVDKCITIEDNAFLMSRYQKEELVTTLKVMGPLKTPGCDGFLVVFFKRCWHIVGVEVSNFCLGVLNSKLNMEAINRTNIVLIPKTLNPTNMVNFRPISLCNVIYKLIAKVIANRFRKVLDACIDHA